jgi:hypothetical protein
MNSDGSELSRRVTGAPTDRAIGMLVSGVLLAVAGLSGILSVSGKS